MSSKLNLNNKIFNAYQSNGNVNDLIVRLETSIDELINEPSKLSEFIKNVPGGNLVNILNTDSSFLPTSKYNSLKLIIIIYLYKLTDMYVIICFS